MNIPSQKIYYIYKHTFTNGIIYIGKGKKYRCNETAKRSGYWKNLFNKYGMPKVELLITNIDEPTAFKKEKEFIKYFKEKEYTLCNLTDGGEGASGFKLSKEAKAKIGKAHSGKKLLDSTKEKLRNARLGTKHSKETLIKFKNRVRTQEAKNKTSETLSDKTKYHFIKDDIEEYCTGYELRQKYNDLLKSGVVSLISGKRHKSYRGWKIKGRNTTEKTKIRKFKFYKDNIFFIGSAREFAEEYNMKISSVSSLASKTRESLFGWKCDIINN